MTRSASSIVLAILVTLGCGAPAQPEPAPTRAESLERGFAAASARHAVPAPLLQAVGWQASRWHHPDEAVADGHHGLMQIPEGTLPSASTLTGIDEDALRTDPAANVHGAAALIGILGDAHFGERPDLNRARPGDWWEVLRIWSGARHDDVADRYAAGVLETLRLGTSRTFADGSTLTLRPVAVTAPAGLASLRQATGETDYAGATWVPADPSNHSDGRSAAVDRLVITTAQGSATAAINTFQDPSQDRSVHYLVHTDGTVTQLVREADAAWHSACYNQRSIGIMLEGFTDDSYTDAQYDAASALARWILDERSLPRTSETVIGHEDVDCGDGAVRVAPGEHFEWDRFLAQINGSRITGEVFFGEDFWVDVYRDDNRLADALVWLDSGQITLSEGDLGRFTFHVPPGAYTVTAEADGYVPGTRDCTVQPDQITWCSVMVTEPEEPPPPVDQGTILGWVVWGDEDENPNDIILNHRETRKVVGATVTLTPGPVVLTTDDDGFYRADLDPGTYTVIAEADGYETREALNSPIDLPADEIRYGSAMVVRPPAPDPVVTISSPTPGQVFTAPEITVTGTVEHDEDIDTVTVAGTAATLADDAFSAEISLNPGGNLIQVVAVDVNGRTGTATVSVTYEAPPSGVDGFVWGADAGSGSPIEGAIVRIGGTEIQTDVDGWFSLDVGPGQYGVTITAEGYQSHSEQVSVVAHERTDLLVALDPEDDEAPPPTVTITSPTDGAVVDGPEVWVEGTISPAEPNVTVLVNGAAADYLSGEFEALVTLLPGANAILVEATDDDGRRGTAAITVTYDEPEEVVLGGVDGIVFDGASGPQARVVGAQVDVGGVQATTGANGTFSLDVPVGQRTVTVTADGYLTYSGSVIVREDRRAALEIGLVAEDDPDDPGDPGDPGDPDPVVEITFPSDGDVVTSPNVLVGGRAHHASVTRVTVNSTDADFGDVDGSFTREITLSPGENAIEAVAFDASGNELGRTLITVTYSGRGSGGCGCVGADTTATGAWTWLGLLAFVLAAGRRRRRSV